MRTHVLLRCLELNWIKREPVFRFELNRQAQPCKASHDSHPGLPSMTVPTVTPSPVRCALLLREEIALLDFRHEAAYGSGS
jgi:hypothetical protein